MRYATLLLLCTLPAWIGPAPSGPEDESVFVKNLRPDQHESLLYVWTSDADAKQPDFLTVVDADPRSEEHTSELQSQSNLVCRLLLEKKNDLDPRLAETST